MIGSFEVKKNIYWVGTIDPAKKVFDLVIDSPYGTTYNSYLILDEKRVLIDTTEEKLAEEWLEKIENIIPAEEIDYVVINHVEPDHSAGLKLLLEKNPNVTVIATPQAKILLKEVVNRDFNFIPAKDGMELKIGKRALRFIQMPFWHWPETMMTYSVEDKILFPCDGFGSNYFEESFFYSKIQQKEVYWKEFWKYFRFVLAPFRKLIIQGLEKLKGLEIEMIAPSHGVIIDTREGIEKAFEVYEEFLKKPRNKIIIAYASAHGNVEKIAKAIHEEIGGELLDLAYASREEVLEKIDSAKAIFFGAPTLNGMTAPQTLEAMTLLGLTPDWRDKRIALFGSYGWSGEGIPLLEEVAKKMRLKLYQPSFRVKFAPSEEEIEKAKKWAKAFIEIL